MWSQHSELLFCNMGEGYFFLAVLFWASCCLLGTRYKHCYLCFGRIWQFFTHPLHHCSPPCPSTSLVSNNWGRSNSNSLLTSHLLTYFWMWPANSLASLCSDIFECEQSMWKWKFRCLKWQYFLYLFMNMEVVVNLFHASCDSVGVMRQVDEDFTSL